MFPMMVETKCGQLFNMRVQWVQKGTQASIIYKFFRENTGEGAMKFLKTSDCINRDKPVIVLNDGIKIFEGLISELRRPFAPEWGIAPDWIGKYEKVENEWKAKLMKLDPARWPTLESVPNVCLQELKAMYRNHPVRVLLQLSNSESDSN